MLINPNGEEKSFRTMEINEELSCSETYKNFTGLINEDTKSLISHLIKVAFNSLPNEPSVLKNYTNGNISSSDQKEIHNEYFFPTQKILNNLILELMESLGYTKNISLYRKSMDSRTGEIDESLDGDDVDPREAFLEDILFTQGIHHKFESLQKFINHEGIETGKVIDKSTTE